MEPLKKLEEKSGQTTENKCKIIGTLREKLLWLGVLLCLWEMVARSGKVSRLLVPTLGEIFQALLQSLTTGNLVREWTFSLSIIFLGIALGCLLALIMTALSSVSTIADSFFRSLTGIMHPVPGIALLPVVILWLGAGRASVLFIIVHSVLWPMVINLRMGIAAIDPVYIQMAQLIPVKGWSLFTDILFPASLPYSMAGLKIAWARSWRALISAEMIFGATGGQGGLGWFLFQKRVFMDMPGMMAGLIVIVITGIVVEEWFFGWAEKRTLQKWGMMR